MDRLSVDVCDQIPSLESRVAGRAPFFYIPDDVVHGVDVAVSHVHTDGADGKSIVLP